MRENFVIEITTFKPKSTIDAADFGKRCAQVEYDYANRQPGFIRRECAVDDDGVWLVLVFWRSLADSKASMAKFGDDPTVADFVEMIDPASMRMSAYATNY